jgi:2-iminobutanoate/2-iminopropanoate deaminase
MTKHVTRITLALLLATPYAAQAQANKAIDFNPQPFSDAVVSGKTLSVAGQQGPATSGPGKGRLEGLYL